MSCKEEGTVSFISCPKIQKLYKSPENTHIISWTGVYIKCQIIHVHFYLVSKKNYDFKILAHI